MLPFRAKSSWLRHEFDERAAALVALAEHLEEEFAANGGERHIAQLVDNKQLHAGQMFLGFAERTLAPGFHQLMQQCRCGDKGDRVAFLAGRQSKCQCHMP